MEDNKISHSFWTFVTWILAILSWTVEHIGAVAGVAAVIASIFSIRASRATENLRLKEQKALEDKIRARGQLNSTNPTKEPGTDL